MPRLYHITTVSNLPAILRAGALRAKNRLDRDRVAHTSIAFENIQDRRARTRVPCGPGGVLHDYVPFYFAPRSPMLYTISRGNVPGCPEGQGPVLHLVLDSDAVVAAGLPYVFTDGHAVMAFSAFFDDVRHLDRIDWAVMESRYWHDTPEFPDRKRRRQAEFLVHEGAPWELVLGIGVIDAAAKRAVEDVLQDSVHRPRVAVRSGWYF